MLLHDEKLTSGSKKKAQKQYIEEGVIINKLVYPKNVKQNLLLFKVFRISFSIFYFHLCHLCKKTTRDINKKAPANIKMVKKTYPANKFNGQTCSKVRQNNTIKYYANEFFDRLCIKTDRKFLLKILQAKRKMRKNRQMFM